MKKVKLFYGDKRLKDIYVGASRFDIFKYKMWIYTKRVAKVTFAAVCITWFGYGMYLTGGMNNPKTVFAEKDVQVVNNSLPPILLKIEKCESSGHQYDANGQVLMHDNGGSVDIGILQINEKIWGAMATKMGYDLTKQADNEAFGLYLFDNYSDSKIWTDSSQCWNK